MFYQIQSHTNDFKLYRDPNSGSKIPYRTIKEMKRLYPDGNFVIIGEIGSVARHPNGGDYLLLGNGKSIPIQPRGSYEKPFEWVAGYIEVNNHSYLAAIRSILFFIKKCFKREC